MSSNWVIPDELKKWAVDWIKDPKMLIDGTVEALMANPHETQELVFKCVEVRYTFDRDALLHVKNPLAIKLLFEDYCPRLSAMFCSEDLRFQFGMLDKVPLSFAEDWDYFSDEYMKDTEYGHGERVLTTSAKAVEEYVKEVLGVKADYFYTSPHYRITVRGEKTYESDDIEEFCETLYKELVK